MADNILHYGDNLEILRLPVADESVDLAYLDPPFTAAGTLCRDSGCWGPWTRPSWAWRSRHWGS